MFWLWSLIFLAWHGSSLEALLGFSSYLTLDGSSSSSSSFYLPFSPFFFTNLGLDFGVTSFEHLPFGPFLITFMHAHPFIFGKRCKTLVFHLPFDHLAHDSFDVATWHLLCCTFNGVFVFPLVGDQLSIVRLRCAFDNFFLMLRKNFKRNTFCRCKHK